MEHRARHYIFTLLCSLFVMCFCNSCEAGFTTKKVDEATETLPEFPKIDVSAPNRFLNDLMLSPLWKVEKERDGSFIAKARSIVPDSPFDETGREFLFEFIATPGKSLPKDYRIRDEYLQGRKTFSSFQIHVVFTRPDLSRVTLGKSGQKATLGVYESFDSKIGPNSSSDLTVKLSSQHEIYVILHEQGADPARGATFAKLLPTLRELAGIAASPQEYRVEQRYAAFFSLFFKPTLKDQEIKRFPGLQDRDTFYGYFRVKPDTSYNGINIKISHPVYCPDEGTRKSSRLQKAEYSGVPYDEKDIVFFLIEDNAVYLSGEYDQQFGTFTGKESFDGTLEVLNDKGTVLLKTADKFKGWQR
jgi:hypothetical protein